MRVTVQFLILVILFVGVIGCKNSDKDSIAQAQICLDFVNETDTTGIQNCVNKLNGLDTQEANIVRCSGEILLGGLTSDKIVNAFGKSGGGGGSAEAALMLTLAVTNQSGGSSNKNQAAKALVACSKSGVSGLIALASFSNIGTIMSAGVGACPDPTNCSASDAAGIVSSCVGGSSCEPASIGQTAVIVADSYCTGRQCYDAGVYKHFKCCSKW